MGSWLLCLMLCFEDSEDKCKQNLANDSGKLVFDMCVVKPRLSGGISVGSGLLSGCDTNNESCQFS